MLIQKTFFLRMMYLKTQIIILNNAVNLEECFGSFAETKLKREYVKFSKMN